MLDDRSLALILGKARTHNVFLDKPVDDAQLRRIHEIMRWGPTSQNSQPARVVFVRTKEGKEKLRPALSPGNLDKTMAAPVTVICAWDARFYDQLPKLFPHVDARPWFTGSAEVAHHTAFLNATLQAGYLLLAARALGLDAGPMAGFDKAQVDAAFFAGTDWHTNFLINLGHGDASKLKGRLPRLAFDDACRLA